MSGQLVVIGVGCLMLGGAVVGFIQSWAQDRHERRARRFDDLFGRANPFRYPGDDRRA